jgi:hypothetical protein
LSGARTDPTTLPPFLVTKAEVIASKSFPKTLSAVTKNQLS